MFPGQLTPERFAAYPPEARQIATAHITLLRKLPLSFVPLLLREVIAYDYKFPAERREVDSQFVYLQSLSAPALDQSMAGFRALQLSSDLAKLDWVNAPARFSEELSAHLWSTHQIDAFRAAAKRFVDTFHATLPVEPLPTRRLAIVIAGQGVAERKQPLFRKLRPHGTYYAQLKAPDGVRLLLDAAAVRAKKYPIPYAHWYVDGGASEKVSEGALNCVSYRGLDPVRTVLLSKLQRMIASGSGSEALRTALAQTGPAEVGLASGKDRAVLDHFQVSVLTEGSGTQIFSTTFVQWTVRELLRRAQPLTVVARFAPRQTERSMYDMIAGGDRTATLDPEGALVDAEMAAWYTWLNQQRLPGADQSAFLAWFEGHGDAVVIGPGIAKNRESRDPADLADVLATLG
jgi:hypothetical protein